ncbi:Short-chain dehydrogenase/reductase SDR [Macrophomina phaseolina MS6]|uniref:Short-chain dehydrogenase/reductase SDR n=1 Tax=Macrophomina phaseolina (strain MS6) TaxID=1126212 RepID=K2QV90_MACPH|nr:Short-chain dehydrogenase/reductase SDR [Macrophomina phaseolina MS6]
MPAVLSGVAFITEAGSGFGQSAAYALAQHGVRQFALADANEAGLRETATTLQSQYGVTDVLQLPAEGGKEDAVEAAVQQAVARFGRLDFAVNNAGFGGPMAGSPDTAPGAFEAHLAQNVTGVWLWHRAELRQMLRQEPRDLRYGRGSIVHVCSVHAFAASPPQFAAGAYVAGRHAVLGLTRSEGVLYAPQQIRINALCPGYTESPLIESSEQLKALIGGLVRDRVPAGRLAKPEEVADAIVFLASPMSSYMYGQALVLDGGYLAQ